MNHQHQQELRVTLLDALEASIYVLPRAHGLTVDELVEIGGRLDLLAGEIRDAVRDLRCSRVMGRLQLHDARASDGLALTDFIIWEAWPRNVDAFQFIHDTLRDLVRREGRQSALIDRDVLVERGQLQPNVSSQDIEVAITLLTLGGVIAEEDGRIRYAPGREGWATPKDQLGNIRHEPKKRTRLRRVLPIVQDVISRRTDGRPAAAEPVTAFGAELDALGHARFSIWWKQTANEMSQADTNGMPTAVTVLAAALAEGALAFMVTKANATGRSMVKYLDGDPTHWRFENLIRSARSGPEPILDQKTADRCVSLNAARQRIHAGRLMSSVPSGSIPDVKPEEGRDAKATLDLLLRAILDWLRKPAGNPPTPP